MTPIHPAKLLLGLLTPIITAAAGWLCAAAAKYGVHLDQAGITSLATAGAVTAAAAMLKLIHDVEQHHPTLERDLTTITTTDRALVQPTAGWPPAAAAPPAAPPA